MEDETIDTTVPTTDEAAETTATPGLRFTSSEPATPEGAATTEAEAGKTVSMPSHAIGKIKSEALEKGRKLALAERERDAKSRGFESYEDMLKAVERTRKTTQAPSVDEDVDADEADPATPETKPQAKTPAQIAETRRLARLEREREAAREEARQATRARAEEEKRRKQIERQHAAAIAAKDAELQMKLSAARSGVADVDYAYHLLKTKISSMSPEELSKPFDDRAYWSKMRETHPHLFQVVEKPAHTSAAVTPVGSPQAPRSSAAEAAAAAAAGFIDARKLSSAEYKAMLRKKGIADPSFS